MTRKKSLKTALLMSGISMLLCSAMLAGTTFAWFSDTVTSGENTIVAGNLHVQLQYDSNPAEENEEDWKDASKQKLFDEEFTWEPGAMLISTPFRVKNTGDLALDYQINIDCTYNETSDGKSLKDVVEVKVVPLSIFEDHFYALDGNDDGGEAVSRADLWKECAEAADSSAGKLENKDNVSDALVVVLYWSPNGEGRDNLYNGVQNDGQLLSIKCKISVLAKQAVSESEKDSVGTDYDKDATYPEA